MAGVLAACADGALRAPAPGGDQRVSQEVGAALAGYRDAVLRGDMAAVGALFDDNASIDHDGQAPVVGRAAIRAFFESFADYQVLAYRIEAGSTALRNGVATQEGSYRQVVKTPAGLTISVEGTFRAQWQRSATGAWRLRRMQTASA